MRNERGNSRGEGRSESRGSTSEGRGTTTTRGASRYQYQERSQEDTDQRKRSTGDRDSFFDNTYPKFKAKEGDNECRLLPPTWEKAKHYGTDVYIHYGYGPDQGSYLCLKKMKDLPCPICEERDQAFADGDQEYADDLKPGHSVLVLVIDRKAEKEGPQLWTIPMKKIDAELLIRSKAKDSGKYLYIDHPDNGYDFYFTRTGTGKTNTEYSGVDIARNPSYLGSEAQQDKWMKLVEENPIPSVLVYHDYEHIAKVCGGKTHSRDEDSSRGGREERPAREESSRGGREESSRGGREESSRGGREESSRGPEIFSHDDIMTMDINQLDKMAFEKLGFKEAELKGMDDKTLREEVIKELGCKPPEAEGSDDRLGDMKNKYSSRESR